MKESQRMGAHLPSPKGWWKGLIAYYVRPGGTNSRSRGQAWSQKTVTRDIVFRQLNHTQVEEGQEVPS